RVLHAVALQGAEVVGVAQLGPQLLEQGPVALLPLGPEGGGQVGAQVGGHPVVVQQGVVDVEQEDDGVTRAHFAPSGAGLCQPPGGATASAWGGPQVRGAYSWTGGGSRSTGSTTRQQASTPSWRANRLPSPSRAAPSSRSYGPTSPASSWLTCSST